MDKNIRDIKFNLDQTQHAVKSNHQTLIAINTHYTTAVKSLCYTTTQTHRDKQLSDSVVCEHLLVCEGDFERTVLLGPLLWPVMFTLLLSTLHSVGYHGNHMDLFLPHHTPEVSDSLWERACGKFRTPRAKELRCTSYVAYLEWQCTFCLVSNPECQI